MCRKGNEYQGRPVLQPLKVHMSVGRNLREKLRGKVKENKCFWR